MKNVVDTNIVFSAFTKFKQPNWKNIIALKRTFQFFSCNYLRIEILKHRSKLLNVTKLTEEALAELEMLVTQNITFIDEHLLPQDLLVNTEALLQFIDPNNTPFVAFRRKALDR